MKRVIVVSLLAYALCAEPAGAGHTLDAADGNPRGVVYVDNDGLVGIGTTSPETPLHISHYDPPGARSLILENRRPQSHAAISFCPDSVEQAYIYANVNGATVYNTQGGGMWFRSNHETKMIIQDNGNVGIGTTSPRYTLDVAGSINLDTEHTGGTFRFNGDQALWCDGEVFYWGCRQRANCFLSKVDVVGQISVSNSAGDPVVELGEGLDYAEGFGISDTTEITAGTVLVIDAENPGKLTVSKKAYDRKVAGVVPGARGLGSGVRLGGSEYDCDVALAGRVFCKVVASERAVEPGDFLTTSSTPGYAMKAADYARAQGAILGKAMETLEKGQKGEILVLVTLQ